MTDRYIRRQGRDPIHAFAYWLTNHGISVYGSRMLRVRGRKSGQPRMTLINLLKVDGQQYLVAPRGHTQWVRNLRAAGEAELVLGRKTRHVTAIELSDDDKIPVLRAYLERFGWEVGQFFDNLTKKSTDAELREVAPGFPAFRLVER